MNDKERNEHFQGFASLLWDDIDNIAHIDVPHIISSGMRREIMQIIAQRAYDMVFHLLKNGDPLDLDMSGNYGSPPDEDVHRSIANLPDLTQWPPSD